LGCQLVLGAQPNFEQTRRNLLLGPSRIDVLQRDVAAQSLIDDDPYLRRFRQGVGRVRKQPNFRLLGGIGLAGDILDAGNEEASLVENRATLFGILLPLCRVVDIDARRRRSLSPVLAKLWRCWKWRGIF